MIVAKDHQMRLWWQALFGRSKFLAIRSNRYFRSPRPSVHWGETKAYIRLTVNKGILILIWRPSSIGHRPSVQKDHGIETEAEIEALTALSADESLVKV